jgi:hypothetical protein
VPAHYAELAVTGAADSLATGLDAAVLVTSLDRLSHASAPGREHQRSLTHIRRVALPTGPAGP